VGRSKPGPLALSRRERQIMDILFRLGRATAQQVLDELPDPPSYSAVRGLLAVLVTKELVDHQSEGQRYVYFARHDVQKERRRALHHVVQTFFEGSAIKAAAALLDGASAQLSEDELDALAKMVDKARKEGR
jgi:predicted transcriptional regulator